MPERLTERIKAGGARGLHVGLLFGAISLVLNFLTAGAAYRHFGFSALSAAVMYVLSGVLGGAIVGILLPAIRNVYSAALVAMAAFMPLIVIVRVINYGSGDWSISELLFMLIIALVMGTLWGPRVWRGWIETINSERG